MLSSRDSLARQIVTSIRLGQLEVLRQILAVHPDLPSSWIGEDGPGGQLRSLLHVATDWPGHFPHVGEVITLLVEAGADVNARFRGAHKETPLHWAASSDDVEALDALLDAGADIDAAGGVVGDGTPLNDATAFAQWDAARRLMDRGARANVFDLAALGLTARALAIVDQPDVSADELNSGFWASCHGSQLETAQALRERGADLNWLPPWEAATPLDAAVRSADDRLVSWLRALDAKSGADVTDS